MRRVTSDAMSGLREEGAFGAGSLAGNPGDLAMADMAPDGSGSGRGDSEYDEVFEEGSGSGDGIDGGKNCFENFQVPFVCIQNHLTQLILK